jgi:hypothetical protein
MPWAMHPLFDQPDDIIANRSLVDTLLNPICDILPFSMDYRTFLYCPQIDVCTLPVFWKRTWASQRPHSNF